MLTARLASMFSKCSRRTAGAGLGFFLSMMVSACGHQGPTSPNDAVNLIALQDRVSLLEQRLTQTNASVFDLQAARSDTVFLNPNSSGFSPLSTPFGIVTVEITGVKARANGSVASIRIGNLLGTTITNFRADVAWGKLAADGAPQDAVDKLTAFRIVPSIAPGHWANAEIPLANLPVDQVGYVSISNANPEGVSLFL